MFSSNATELPEVEALKTAAIQMLSPPATQIDVEDTVASTPPMKKAKLAEKTKEEAIIESMEMATTTKQASGQQSGTTGGKKKNEEKPSSSKDAPASNANGESKGKKKPPKDNGDGSDEEEESEESGDENVVVNMFQVVEKIYMRLKRIERNQGVFMESISKKLEKIKENTTKEIPEEPKKVDDQEEEEEGEDDDFCKWEENRKK